MPTDQCRSLNTDNGCVGSYPAKMFFFFFFLEKLNYRLPTSCVDESGSCKINRNDSR